MADAPTSKKYPILVRRPCPEQQQGQLGQAVRSGVVRWVRPLPAQGAPPHGQEKQDQALPRSLQLQPPHANQKRDLQNHVNTHAGTRPHCCRDCDASFPSSSHLARHVRFRHSHEKPHRCTECDYAAVELSTLKKHMRFHTGEWPYQCPHCTYGSMKMDKLSRHLRIHTGEKSYGCNICQERFTQSTSFKAHKLIHSGNKPSFHCDFCPTTCSSKANLRIHMQKLHTSDKPLKCKRCGKTFPDRYSYKLHSKSHEEEKCFKCDLCPYASISQRHLESHMLIHTDQKPFRCDECDQAFRQKQILQRHKNLYHNPNYVVPAPKEKTNECSKCGKAFRHKEGHVGHPLRQKRRQQGGSRGPCQEEEGKEGRQSRVRREPESTSKVPTCQKKRPDLAESSESDETSKPKTLPCKIKKCRRSFSYVTAFIKHLNKHKERDKGAFLYPCPHCPISTKTSKDLLFHMHTHNLLSIL